MARDAGDARSKIASFYADPVKQACDALSAHKAFQLRSCSIDPGPRWMAMRCAKFVASIRPRALIAACGRRAGTGRR